MSSLKIKINGTDYVVSYEELNGFIVGMCSCGGTINVHKRACPEYKAEEQQGEDFPIGMIDFSDNDFDSHKPLKKCECGAESVGSSGHSPWCPKG